MQKKSQTSDELVRQLQAKVRLTEKAVVDILAFQTQTLEAHKELESTQRSLFNKVEAIQNHFQVVNQALDNIFLKEGEAIAALDQFPRSSCVVGKRMSIYGFQVVFFRENQR
jgi:hypothetical protein